MLTRIQSKFAVCLFLALFNGMAGILLFMARGIVPMAIILLVVSSLLVMLVIVPPSKDVSTTKKSKKSSPSKRIKADSIEPVRAGGEHHKATFATIIATTGLLMGTASGMPIEEVQRSETSEKEVIEVRNIRREDTRISGEFIDYSQVQQQTSLPINSTKQASGKNTEYYREKQRSYRQQQLHNQQLWGEARPWQIYNHYHPDHWKDPNK